MIRLDLRPLRSARAPLAAAALALLALPLPAQTVDEIVARNVKARGGMEKLKAVSSVRMSGRMVVGPGMVAPLTIELKRPRKVRIEVTVQGQTVVQAFDGSSGWAVMPMLGKNDPQPMSAEEARHAEEQADFDGPLVDWKEKGHRVELVGREKVPGGEAFKLKVTLKGGEVRYFFVDASTFLEVRAEGARTSGGSEVEFENVLSDYKEVGGLMIAHAVEMGPKGSPEKSKLTLDKVELNPSLDDARFKMPATQPKPAPKPPSS
jgi:outer membrane lipoprotein-sorting protein